MCLPDGLRLALSYSSLTCQALTHQWCVLLNYCVDAMSSPTINPKLQGVGYKLLIDAHNLESYR